MGIHRFVHLSDIHFGQERNGELVTHDDVRRELLNDCRKKMRPWLGDADGIIVTGDVAYSGKKSEYERAAEWLDEVAATIGCQNTKVCVVPGNHDIDIDKIDYWGKVAHDRIRNGTLGEMDAELEQMATGVKEGNPLIQKLGAYRNFAEQYGCNFVLPAEPMWQRDFGLGTPHILRFVGLNSVQVSDKQDSRGAMVLGNRQYVIPNLDDVEYVVLIHHPLNWLMDEQKARQYLESRARVIMVGHEHVPSVEKRADLNGNERLVLHAGAVTPQENEEAYNYCYNWLEFSRVDCDGAHGLQVKVYPRKWIDGQTEFRADRERCPDAGCGELVLKCPQLINEPVEVGSSTSIDGSENAKVADCQGSNKMVADDDERFARLRLLFWRYLDWRQRLNVLVKLDILPNTPDRPLPQTMERLALDSARKDPALARALWDAVMDAIPEDKRSANPFLPTEN